MKKSLLIPTAATVLSGFVVSPVSAQDGPAPQDLADIQIVNPVNGSTVGRKFTLNLRINPKCVPTQVSILNDLNNPTVQGGYPIRPTGGNGSYAYQFDLNQPYVYDGAQPRNPVYPPAGRNYFIFSYSSLNDANCAGEPPTYSLNITNNSQAGTPQTQVSIDPSPSATPSPSAAPVMATPTAEVKSDKSELDPMAALILGALLGAAILALAEVSAVEYRKKHGPKGDITKKAKK